ncbi:hypothetical protein B0H14DRAFT_3470690 [Mycena olivaceomarginata]|nr:hypothetical protein B0H14DRAFT_3470690 [Mycena olivaceomarginata]
MPLQGPNSNAARKPTRLFTMLTDPDDYDGLSWVGTEKPCFAVPKGALDVGEKRLFKGDGGDTIGEDGRFRVIEWADQPDWYHSETHFRGWIPLEKQGDQRRGAWARRTKELALLENAGEGLWRIGGELRETMKEDVAHFRALVEGVGESDRMDSETPEAFCVVMEARRAALEHLGFLNWWTQAMADWFLGVHADVCRGINSLDLRGYEKRGFLVTGLFEMRDPRFHRLSPGVVQSWLREDKKNDLEDLWVDDLPIGLGITDPAGRYDRHLQLKIAPYSRPRRPFPTASDISGPMWKRRRLEDDEVPDQLHEFYHHLVVESQSKQVTRIIFHRFHPKPRKEELTSTGIMTVDECVPADLSEIRERFKGRCAPVYGQSEEQRQLLEPPPSVLGSRYFGSQSSYVDDLDYDATTYGRELGVRLTSPRSDQSSERREYDSTEPMAHVVGWVEALRRTQGPDSVSLYSDNSSSRRPLIDSMTPVRTFLWKAAGTALREDQRPRLTGEEGDRETMEELALRRAGWLNAFADWGRDATYEGSLWRMPVNYSWRPEILECGYLLIDEAAEFRLPLEWGIPFKIAFKRADCDRFPPSNSDEAAWQAITKATVDLHAKGPVLLFAPIKELYREYRGAASWIMRAFLGLFLVQRLMNGPSVQLSIHQAGSTDSGDPIPIGVIWDDVSDSMAEAVFGFVAGATPDQDRYPLPH